MHLVENPEETWQEDYKLCIKVFERYIYKCAYKRFLCFDHMQVYPHLFGSSKTLNSRTRTQGNLRIYRSQKCKRYLNKIL